MNRLITFCFLLLCSSLAFGQTNQLVDKLKAQIVGKKATVGVAVIFNGSELITINNQYRFPMMSVYKFHEALAVLDYLAKKNQTLETEVYVKKSELLPDTYSPMRDKYPEGNFNITIGDLLRYSISQSDNNACDILFRYIGGPEVVDKYIRKLGIKDVNIETTEQEMHEDVEKESLNWCTPSAAALSMETFLQNDLFPRNYKLFLQRALIQTSTGEDKLKGLLPKKHVMVAHKTGSSSRNDFGIKIADNDLGFVLLPNGSYYTIAVFVMNSQETDKANAALIAKISKTVYDYFLANYSEKTTK